MTQTNDPVSSELKAILDAAGTMIITTDLVGTVRIFNPAAERLLGWRADAVVGRHTPALWHDPKEVAARAAELSYEFGRTVSPGFEVFVAKARDQVNEQRQWTFIHNDGSRVPVLVMVSAIRDAAGTITGYMGTAQDVTEHKDTEQALRLLSSDLARLSGSAYYDAIAVHLSELVQCEITAVFGQVPGESNRVVSLALSEEGVIQPNLDYSTVGTPCADVLERGSCIIPCGVQQQYPDDTFFVDKHVEAYAGVRMIGSTGRQLGHLAVMSRHPLRHPERVESVLKLFCLSVVARMERQSAEQRLSDLFELSPDATIITDHDGIILQANRQVATTFGWTPGQLVGQRIATLMPVHLHAEYSSLRDRYVQTGLPRAIGSGRNELLGLRKDGTVFPVEISLSPIQTPEQVLVATAMRDISDKIRSEKELKEAHAFTDSFIEGVSGLFYVLDASGNFVRWNQYLQQLLGLTSDQMRQSNANSIIHEQDRDRIAKRIAEVFRDGQAVDEARLLLKDGPRHFLLNGRRMEINGEVYLVGSGADITNRKQAEEEVQLLNQTLEERVRERTKALTKANTELARANQSKSEFLATMSHELRTPINGILGMNELLLTSELSERQRAYVEACTSSGKVLAELINDILDLSKIEAGKLELDPHECSVEAFTYDVVDIMSHAVRAKHLLLNCRVAPDACVVGLFDDTRLRQVLVNLVSNAVKFTSSGSITIAVDRIEKEDRTVRLRFSISDTGMGIPRDRLDRLFKTFSQVDSSTTRHFGGTGLGLAICKQLIELMGGEIGVESQIGVGTTFWFEVEIATSDVISTTDKAKRLLAGTRLIAIETPDRKRFQVGECLRSWNCPFEQVATVKAALAEVQSGIAAGHPARIVLADCGLVTGDEFVQFQELVAKPNLDVIGLGAPSDEDSRNRLDGLGIRQVLDDPIRPSALFDMLASVLFRKREAAPFEAECPPLPREPEGSLSGHILVAEDNRINQLYITELLEHIGCTVDLVVNGEAAVAAVQKQRYDLVLMDCQMPEMDGFTAVREIRKREAERQISERLQILALTANALKGDRERCLEAGMDDYVSKPVESEQMKAVLAKYLGRASTKKHTGGATSLKA